MFNIDWIKRIFRPEETAQPGHYQYRPLAYTQSFGANVWAIGGGKGGVGKSLMASNIGLLLSKLGKKVLLIDADLGAANLHTFLGMEGGRAALSAYLKEEISELGSLIIKTPFPGLDLISGAKDSLDVADVSTAKISRLKEALRRVEYDYVVLDIGPGTSANLLDMFLISNEGIILSTPEPTTIENNYRFLKCLFLRKIKTLADAQEDGRLKDLLQKIFSDRWAQRVKTVADIMDSLSSLDPEQGRYLKEHIAASKISMIMNQTKKADDRTIGPSIKKACSDYFGIEISYLGSVSYEESVVDSIRTRKPLAAHYAASGAAKAIEGCLHQLLNRTRPLNAATINTF